MSDVRNQDTFYQVHPWQSRCIDLGERTVAANRAASFEEFQCLFVAFVFFRSISGTLP